MRDQELSTQAWLANVSANRMDPIKDQSIFAIVTALLEIRDNLSKANEIIDRYVSEKLESDKTIIKLLEELNLREELKWTFKNSDDPSDLYDQSENPIESLKLSVNCLEARINACEKASLQDNKRLDDLEKK